MLRMSPRAYLLVMALLGQVAVEHPVAAAVAGVVVMALSAVGRVLR